MSSDPPSARRFPSLAPLERMKTADIDQMLSATLDDRRLSRGERRALEEALAPVIADPDRAAFVRHRAFELARAALDAPPDRAVVEWVEQIVKLLDAASVRPELPAAEAWFSDEGDCAGRIVSFLSTARRSLDVCVFTITDDRIARALRDAHARSVRLRIVTDDEKSTELGSDVELLCQLGVPLRMDRSAHHMHHKFAISDGCALLTGSYNWTRSAALHNEENFVITEEPRLVRRYSEAFERLWSRLG